MFERDAKLWFKPPQNVDGSTAGSLPNLPRFPHGTTCHKTAVLPDIWCENAAQPTFPEGRDIATNSPLFPTHLPQPTNQTTTPNSTQLRAAQCSSVERMCQLLCQLWGH